MEPTTRQPSEMPAPARGWKFLSPFMVRTAGFSFETLRTLHFDLTNAMVDRVLRTEKKCRALKDELWHSMYDLVGTEDEKTKRAMLLTIRKRLFAGSTIREKDLEEVRHAGYAELHARLWDLKARFAECQAALAECRVVFEQELTGKRETLREIAAQKDFQEAVFLSSADMYENALKPYVEAKNGLRNSKAKEVEERVTLYLQRFHAKNETVSFFGPTCYGHWDPCSTKAVSFSENSSTGVLSREIFFSHWGIGMLADEIGADAGIKQYLYPRLNPVCRVLPDGVFFHFLNVHFPLTEKELELIDICDGEKRASEIAQFLVSERGWKDGNQAMRIIGALVEKRILFSKIEIPSNLFQPLEYLMSFLQALPENYAPKVKWLGVTGEFDRLRELFRKAELTQRIRLLHDLEKLYSDSISPATLEKFALSRRETHGHDSVSHRRHGMHYGDRTLIFEECLGNLQGFTFGQPLLKVLTTDLQNVLNLDAYRGVLQRRYYQKIGRIIYDEMALTQQPVCYSSFVQKICAEEEADPTRYTSLVANERETFEKSLMQKLSLDAADCRVVSIGNDLLPESELKCLEGLPWVGSIDISIIASSVENINQGNFKIVIGEVQNFIGVWGYSYYYPDRARLENEVLAMIHELPDSDSLSSIVLTHDSKIKGYEYPGYSIEFRAKSMKARSLVIPYSDLRVVDKDGELQLESIRQGTTHRLYCGVSESLEERIFSCPKLMHTPLLAGKHTPRIEAGNIIYQRETWRFNGEEIVQALQFDEPYELMLNAKKFSQAHMLPDRVFVKVKEETKPVMIDFANFFLVELLYKLASRCEVVSVSEMLPDECGIWLRDIKGGHTAEFRMTVYRS
jgi:hypothetical protein